MLQNTRRGGKPGQSLTDADRAALKGPLLGMRAVETFFLNLNRNYSTKAYNGAMRAVHNLNSKVRKDAIDLSKKTHSGSVQNIYKSRRHDRDPEV